VAIDAAGDVAVAGSVSSESGFAWPHFLVLKLAGATGSELWRREIRSNTAQRLALGLGATAALLCDVVIAARSATFGDTHVAMGLTAGDGGQLMWPLLIGPARAKYYMMTGERFDAEEAERMGLVNFVVDDDKLMERAIELATKLAAGPL
jgi:1,4-dihydroxy-2-naphthoyl-CoA synthase